MRHLLAALLMPFFLATGCGPGGSRPTAPSEPWGASAEEKEPRSADAPGAMPIKGDEMGVD